VAPKDKTRELADAFAPRLSKLIRLLIRETAAAGMSRTHLSVLATLRDAGPARITELAEAERVAQPSMTTLVSRLEEQGWARRQSDPADGRAVVVAITPAGLAELERMTAARAESLARRLGALTPKERAALAAALPALDRLVEQEPGAER
jgi:DNA-binding MarR family transcriptional regulator